MAQPSHESLVVNDVGEITVVSFRDSKILDEANIGKIENDFIGLVEQPARRMFLVDFSNVRYLSSAALGMLLRVNKRICEADKRIRFCANHPAIYECYAITKLSKLFRFGGSEAEAAFKNKVMYRCPVGGCGAWARSSDPRSHGVVPMQICPRCATQYYVSAANFPDSGEWEGTVEEIISPTYPGEFVRLDTRPWGMEIHGRLDLFALDVVRDIWECLPQPRVFGCDFGRTTEITSRGAEGLVQLVQSEGGNNRVWLSGDKSRAFDGFSQILAANDVEWRLKYPGGAEVNPPSVRVRIEA